MKVGIIIFHKNIKKIYPQEWIEKCINSIKNQTYKNYTIYEINYGGTIEQLFVDSKFYSINKINHADAMNFILDEAFNDSCDYVFNINLDDFYHLSRLEKQIPYLQNGYDIVSSNFCLIDESDQVISYRNMKNFGDIKYNLNINHNVIAHPSVGYSSKFWQDENNRYDITKIPIEDLDLWKRSINNGYKFYIVDEVLLYHRMHHNKVSNNIGLR